MPVLVGPHSGMLLGQSHLIAFIERSPDDLPAQGARPAHHKHRVLGHCARAVLCQLRCCHHPCATKPLRPPTCCTHDGKGWPLKVAKGAKIHLMVGSCRGDTPISKNCR